MPGDPWERLLPSALNRAEPPLDKELEEASACTEDAIRNVIEARFKRIEDKAQSLMDIFGIPKTWSGEERWHALAIFLARRYVRGFQEARSPGAKQKWTAEWRAELRIAVDDLVEANNANPEKGVNWACVQLAKREPWKGLVRSGRDAAGALRKQYNNAEPPMVAALRYSRYQGNNQLAALIAFGDLYSADAFPKKTRKK